MLQNSFTLPLKQIFRFERLSPVIKWGQVAKKQSKVYPAQHTGSV